VQEWKYRHAELATPPPRLPQSPGPPPGTANRPNFQTTKGGPSTLLLLLGCSYLLHVPLGKWDCQQQSGRQNKGCLHPLQLAPSPATPAPKGWLHMAKVQHTQARSAPAVAWQGWQELQACCSGLAAAATAVRCRAATAGAQLGGTHPSDSSTSASNNATRTDPVSLCMPA